MLKGFREFLMRGNVIDLAVAVIVGAAFSNIVAKLQEGFLNPLISALFGKPNLDSVGHFTINNSDFSIGVILTAILNFILIALAIYFLIVLPMKRLVSRMDKTPDQPTPDPS